MRYDAINVLIGGAAGQGLVTIAEILLKVLVREGYSVVVTQDYMSRVRGGHNTFAIRIAPHTIMASEEGYELLVALNEETVELHRSELNPSSAIIVDSSLDVDDQKALKVPFKDLAEKRYHNVASLGVLAKLMDIDPKAMVKAVLDYFGKKSDDILEANKKAFKAAYDWTEVSPELEFLKLPKPRLKKPRILMHGNQAIAMGALSAGCGFYSFYPMTPSTSIGVTLAGAMGKLPIVVEQTEDEIAAMNMAVGASIAGAPAMVGTSGGGFALMVETLSLAAVSETPLVIALAQRPGPATGLPTRTEQGDLEFALHAGHGEFPRVMFAPGNVEQCFHLTRKAFELAEKTQGPAFILTDQMMSDYYKEVEPFDVDNLPPVKPGADPDSVEKPYRRYRLTENGVSPRLLPGKSEHLVMVDSHEHYEDGYINEEADVRISMNDKRLKKNDILLEEFIPPDYYGEQDPEILLVCWGSTLGACEEAARMIAEKGKKAGCLHFSQVWPLVPDKFIGILEKAKQVVMVEGNALGQFARLIRRETGFLIEKKILKYDGRPFTPEYILRELGLDK